MPSPYPTLQLERKSALLGLARACPVSSLGPEAVTRGQGSEGGRCGRPAWSGPVSLHPQQTGEALRGQGCPAPSFTHRAEGRGPTGKCVTGGYLVRVGSSRLIAVRQGSVPVPNCSDTLTRT